ncbi:hypothetical protein AV530_011098 [Patagioenas fasciata monilis]|uniref:Uncharacterized protein n=1 Tax=Patagioenas fasciata monilis TaxID=372326 RepID=A0A1V4JXE1_PATFA|nr:hypothetical protein AV530_011098 [Patagioenas fasciata monilis]
MAESRPAGQPKGQEGKAQAAEAGTGKVKVQLELNSARDTKIDKRGFYGYVSQKRKIKESVPTLMSKTDKLVTADKEKAENVKAVENYTIQLLSSRPTVSTPEVCSWEAEDPKGIEHF